MEFKIDENLPAEIAELLRVAGHGAMTVVEQGLHGADDANVAAVCQRERKILVTLDMDFGDIRTYPPEAFAGTIVLRLNRQDKESVLRAFSRAVTLLDTEPVENRLWV